ncbi:hypothetical protein BDW71DRAFT_7159 [Aspergillus fruticulosus]
MPSIRQHESQKETSRRRQTDMADHHPAPGKDPLNPGRSVILTNSLHNSSSGSRPRPILNPVRTLQSPESEAMLWKPSTPVRRRFDHRLHLHAIVIPPRSSCPIPRNSCFTSQDAIDVAIRNPLLASSATISQAARHTCQTPNSWCCNNESIKQASGFEGARIIRFNNQNDCWLSARACQASTIAALDDRHNPAQYSPESPYQLIIKSYFRSSPR